MRIISGSRRGLVLLGPKGDHTRPTEDRVKENLFNLLGPIPFKSRVLDCFAGSGALGLETMSRGEGYGLFFEKDKNTFEILLKNIKKCRFEDHCHVHPQDVLKGLKEYEGQNFDYIFIDPPYDKKFLYEKIIKIVMDKDLLSLGGKVIIERMASLSLSCPDYFELWKTRQYRDTVLEIWDKRVV